MTFSELFKINGHDITKGLIVAVFTSVLVIVNDNINAGSFSFDYMHIGKTALAAAVAYLLKQLFTNSAGQFLSGETK